MEFFDFISEQYWLVGALLVLIYLFVWNEKRRGGKTVNSHQLTQLINNDEAVVVDLRDAADYKAGHITSAINIPYNRFQERWEELEPHKDKHIVLVDKMGQHTGAIGNTLRAKQFQVSRLGGGIMEWQNQNLPLTK